MFFLYCLPVLFLQMSGPPIAVSGEEITPAALELMQRYGVTEVSVLRR